MPLSPALAIVFVVYDAGSDSSWSLVICHLSPALRPWLTTWKIHNWWVGQMTS